MIQRCAFTLSEKSPVIVLLCRRCRNRQRQRFNFQEAVTGIDYDRIVGIRHHSLTINSNACYFSPLLLASYGICARIFLRNQSTVRAIQCTPYSITIFCLKDIAPSAGNTDIRGACLIIKMLLVRIRKTDIKYLTGIIVRAWTDGVRIPLVGRNVNVYTDRLNRQWPRNIDNTVILFRRNCSCCAKCDLRVLGRCCACSGISLWTIKCQGG